MSETLAVRWMRRYKVFFLLGLVILVVQIFLAYKSLKIPQLNLAATFLGQSGPGGRHEKNADYSVADDEDLNSNLNAPVKLKEPGSGGPRAILNLDQLGFVPDCEITTKEAISAIHRAKTKDCKKHIANITCLIQSGQFYARSLPSFCPHGNYTANKSLGCYKDEKEFRLLSGYYTNFKTNNSPKKCIQMCLQSGFPYAGVQYSTECFCGTEEPPTSAKLPDPSCNMKCPGDPKGACGGYFSINIYETGISKFAPQIAETVPKSDDERARIAYLLTLNGRALRQVHRLIKALYSPRHVFYVHVDSRQDYLYRELLKLEPKFHNIRLARRRFSTIWGGASLLTMLLHCMKDLLESTWEWDFVINLSESDFPVKTNEKLVDFLTANKGKNFVKSHGRETQRFIQKQGLDKTFVECDTHMWRVGERELPSGIQIDGGSDWIALSKEFVWYVTNETSDPLVNGLLTIFRHTLLPAESFFHTVLRNSKFCGTYVDNNLHVTNWKRRLGCKCQYKHVVDWCGCSPNDFKPDDWPRLLGTEQKLLFFARKFEPIINQAIILQLEEWLFGPYTSDYTNLNSYWQSIYHREDKSPSPDDAVLTIADSIMRINGQILGFEPVLLEEITNFKENDEYQFFILRYSAKIGNRTVELETRAAPVQSIRTARNSQFVKRIRAFEISSEYDQKEQISRNFGKFLGPFTDLVLSFRFIGTEHAENHSYNLTILWIDPTGSLQDFNEIHVESSQSTSINYSKATLKHPLTPGIWTVKLIGRTALFLQAKFLITPLSFEAGKPITQVRTKIVNLGSRINISYPSEWKSYFSPKSDVQLLKDRAEVNARRFGGNLTSWIDGLVDKFFLVKDTCSVNTNVSFGGQVPQMCKETDWSTFAPDPKSDVYALLKRRYKSFTHTCPPTTAQRAPQISVNKLDIALSLPMR